jgi:hypothetical protein
MPVGWNEIAQEELTCSDRRRTGKKKTAKLENLHTASTVLLTFVHFFARHFLAGRGPSMESHPAARQGWGRDAAC